MSCPGEVVVAEIGCTVVQVATAGPQGPPGPPGSIATTTPILTAALPAPAAGLHAMVTDATSTVFYSVLVGGAGNTVPVWADGTSWRIG
jgi:hypothetical protein